MKEHKQNVQLNGKTAKLKPTASAMDRSGDDVVGNLYIIYIIYIISSSVPIRQLQPHLILVQNMLMQRGKWKWKRGKAEKG